MPKEDDFKRLAKPLGTALMEGRRRVGLTQEELGEQCNLTASYVARVERGERLPSLVVLDRLTRAVGVEIGEIWPDAAKKNPATKSPTSKKQAAEARLLKATEKLSPADLRQLTTLIQRLLRTGSK